MKIKNKIPQEVIFIHNQLTEKGFECYIVGGFIRNILLYGNDFSSDIDIATDATPQQVASLFEKVIPTGIKHGTVTVLKNKKSFEVTTYRHDGKYSDTRRPDEVSFVSNINEDLARRDFTINAFAYDYQQDQCLDLFGGKGDLELGLIKAIGEPLKRFQEDGLRMMRACRFASQLSYQKDYQEKQFKIEKETLLAIQQCSDSITKISSERIRDELIKILNSDKPSIGIEWLRKTNLLEKILPELYQCIGVEQNVFHQHDVYNHLLATLDSVPQKVSQKNYLLRLTALLHDIGKPKTKKLSTKTPYVIQDGKKIPQYSFYGHDQLGQEMSKKILSRLKFSNKEIFFVSHLISLHMFYYTEEWTDAAVRRFVKRVGKEYITPLFDLRIADILGKGDELGKESDLYAETKPLQKRLEKLKVMEMQLEIKDLKINGSFLMKKFGLPSSPKLGEILKKLLDKVIENQKLNNEKDLVVLAEKILGEEV